MSEPRREGELTRRPVLLAVTRPVTAIIDTGYRERVIRRILAGVGRTFIGLGMIILLFGAYQLWGTSLSASRSQEALRRQLSGRLPADRPTPLPRPRSTASAMSTVPSSPAIPTTPPPQGNAVGIIKIPRIGVDKVIIEGTDTTDLRHGPGHYSGTPLPGQPGNAAIAGHRTTYGAPFSQLNELRPRDPILIAMPQGTFRYDVFRSIVVSPSDLSVIGPTPTAQLTLTTCTPRFSAAQRLIVQATLVGSPVPFASPVAASGRRAPALAGGLGSWPSALAWGLAPAVVAVGVVLLAEHRRRRWPVYVLGTPLLLATLFMFFGAISNLLPATI